MFRVGSCGDQDLASPVEMQQALAKYGTPPTLTISFHLEASKEEQNLKQASQAVGLLLSQLANESIVLIHLTPPRTNEGPPAHVLTRLNGGRLREAKARWSVTVARDVAKQIHPELPGAMDRFGAQCPELTDRTKLGNGRTRRECTNVC